MEDIVKRVENCEVSASELGRVVVKRVEDKMVYREAEWEKEMMKRGKTVGREELAECLSGIIRDEEGMAGRERMQAISLYMKMMGWDKNAGEVGSGGIGDEIAKLLKGKRVEEGE